RSWWRRTRRGGAPGLESRSRRAAGSRRFRRAAADGRDYFASCPAIFDRGEADVPRHDDAAAVSIERAPRIDFKIARPFESVAAVANGEAQLVVAAAEFDFGPL